MRPYRLRRVSLSGGGHEAICVCAKANSSGRRRFEPKRWTIKAIVETGRFAELNTLERELPGALAELTEIPGLGPKRVRALYRELGIESLDELRTAAKAGKVRALSGFGEKTERKILRETERRTETAPRFGLPMAEEQGEPLLRHLGETKGVKQAVIAGSYRRRKETVGDLDILVSARKGSKVMARFVG